MSEPNKTRTIPLHIADQAVAACEAEIQKLKEENAQLKHKLGRLLGAQQEWTLVEPEHYARLKDKSACQAECLEAFDKENARLKAEVERLEKGIQPEGSNDAVGRAVNVLLEKEKEIARLKAEVNALMTNPTSRLLRAKQAENAVLAIENDSLKAEVERLRKAGDDLADEVIGCYNGEGYDPADSESLRKWNAAKEGKQS